MRLKGQKSPAQLVLESFLEQHPGLDLHDAVDHYLQDPLANVSLEEVRDYSAQAVDFITTDAASINEWLVKSLDHLDERMEDYGTQARDFEDQARKLTRAKIKGGFSYRSIMRNLSTGEAVAPETLAVELDKFLTKIHSILSHGSGGEFQKLIKLMEDFELGEGSEEKLQVIFDASRSYYKSMLPSQQTKSVHGLEIPEGRELWMDKTVFLGGKVFYSFTPTELSQSSGSLWSGYVRATKSELDLKAEVPYLTKAQCQTVCKALQRHATGLLRAKAYQNTADRLLALSRDLNRKYTKAKEQRKYSTKPYVLLMNMTVSHLYGIQIKAINQAEGIYKASLKYVDKSLEALEEKKTA